MSWDYRSILSGERRDPIAVCLRAGLWLATWPYRIAVAIRNRRFDRGRDVHPCGVPVISVGNLTTGGTGKTPIVCYLAKHLRQRGLRVALVSRGYGRGDDDANDEAMELHDRLPDVPHIQDPDRVEAARIAVEELEAELILMDDGMQHRRLHRDLNLVVIDATCPFGFGYLLPRGLLREPISALRRADLCMLTRCDSVPEKTLHHIQQQIREVAGELPMVQCVHRPSGLLAYPSRITPIDRNAHSSVAVLTAIGNPEAFEHTVRACGMQIVASRHLRDHDPYGPETVRELIRWAQQLDASICQIVCTHKDLVKLRTDRLGNKPLLAIQIDLEIVEGVERLEAALSAFDKAATQSGG
jgi:tetraacyldisaccharide 4'-kinase